MSQGAKSPLASKSSDFIPNPGRVKLALDLVFYFN